jgi:putative ABC transport system substrate-binding protein
MKRREFIAGTAAALLVSPQRSWAEGARRRLGVLAVGDGSGRALNQTELALFDGLRSHGWDRRKKPDYRVSFFRAPGSTASFKALALND